MLFDSFEQIYEKYGDFLKNVEVLYGKEEMKAMYNKHFGVARIVKTSDSNKDQIASLIKDVNDKVRIADPLVLYDVAEDSYYITGIPRNEKKLIIAPITPNCNKSLVLNSMFTSIQSKGENGLVQEMIIPKNGNLRVFGISYFNNDTVQYLEQRGNVLPSLQPTHEITQKYNIMPDVDVAYSKEEVIVEEKRGLFKKEEVKYDKHSIIANKNGVLETKQTDMRPKSLTDSYTEFGQELDKINFQEMIGSKYTK